MPARPGLSGQRRLGAVQRLALGLLDEAEDHRPGRRIQVQANDIHQFRFELGVGAELENVHPPRLQLVVGPYLRDGVLADPDLRGQGPGGPMRRTARRLPGQRQFNYPLHRVRRQPGLPAAALGDRADPTDALLGEPVPPPTHCVRINPAAAGDLLVRHPVRGPQQRLRLHHLAVRQHR